METMYRRRVSGRGSRTARKKHSAGLPGRERIRLLQLGVSALLFLLVFFGRGILPGQLAAWRAILCADMDLQGAAAAFGQTLADGGTVLEALDLCWARLTGVDADLPQLDTKGIATVNPPEFASYIERGYSPGFGKLFRFEQARSAPADSAGADLPESGEAVVTAVAQQFDPDGAALPERVSLQFYNLGLEETAVPVMGTVTSGFGFRDHPVSKVHSFHTAVDIGTKTGTDVLAFAEGTVRYIGENDIFGLYLKIDHDNGVSSFYAHCEELLVEKGEYVRCGQVIAKSGETGNATGPHLHFSIEKDGVRLDPAYYLDFS